MVRVLLLGLVAAAVIGAFASSGSSRPSAVPSGQIAFADRVWPRNASDNWEILVVDAAGGRVQNLSRSPCDDVGPAWSRDGRNIAFVCVGSEKAGLWVMRANGAGRRHLVKGELYCPAWSPDGSRVAFNRRAGGKTSLWVMMLRDGAVRRIATDAGCASWSRGGRWLAVDRDGAHGGIWRLHVASGRSRRLTRHAGDGSAAWSPDGTRIAFIRDDAIWVMRPDGAAQRRVFAGTKGRFHDVAPKSVTWSPDSRFFAYDSDLPGGLGGGVWVVHSSGSGPRRVAAGNQIGGLSWPAHT